jgi:hypothetical protein
MMKSSVFLGICLCLAAALQPVSAATYHVSQLGADGNPGTEERPFRTVQKAANTAQAGDTVLIGPGFFNETVTIKSFNGTEEKRITFDGQGVAQVYRMVVRKPYVTIQNLEFKWPETQSGAASGFITLDLNSHYAVITNNFVNATGSTHHEGIRITVGSGPFDPTASSHSLLISNVITGVRGQVALLMAGTSNLFTGNVITNVIQADFIRLWGESNVIRGNIFSNNVNQAGLGFHADFIQTFGNNGRGSRGHIIERNLILDTESQISQLVEGTPGSPDLIGTGAIGDWTFRNNIFANTKLGSSISIPNTKWYNNVFYRCNYSGGHAIGSGNSDRGTSEGIRVINNVFLDVGLPDSDNSGWYRVNDEYDDKLYDYNFVANNNFSPVREDCSEAGTPTSRFRWCEMNGINGGNPRFVDAVNYDFRLLPGSPLIGRGLALPGFADDLAGNGRPVNGPWDIGAFQFGDSDGPERPAPPRNFRRN